MFNSTLIYFSKFYKNGNFLNKKLTNTLIMRRMYNLNNNNKYLLQNYTNLYLKHQNGVKFVFRNIVVKIIFKYIFNHFAKKF